MQLLNKEEFDKLTRNEKRVAIAKDVLMRIEQKNLHVQCGDFINIIDEQKGLLDYVVLDQDVINNNKCMVCAKGAIFCSWVGNFNGTKGSPSSFYAQQCDFDDHNWDNNPQELLEVFGKDLLNIFECIFEGWDFKYNDNHWSVKVPFKANEYLNEEENTQLLIDMMNYLIDNNGEFPVVLYDNYVDRYLPVTF